MPFIDRKVKSQNLHGLLATFHLKEMKKRKKCTQYVFEVITFSSGWIFSENGKNDHIITLSFRLNCYEADILRLKADTNDTTSILKMDLSRLTKSTSHGKSTIKFFFGFLLRALVVCSCLIILLKWASHSNAIAMRKGRSKKKCISSREYLDSRIVKHLLNFSPF